VAKSILFFFFLFAEETKMATGGGQISLPLAIGWIAATRNGWFYLFILFFVGKTKMAIGGGRISLPLAVWVDHGHPQWPDLFFVCRTSHRRLTVGGGVWAVDHLFGCLIS
jgi:hypothetical protein